MIKQQEAILTRHPANPILGPSDVPFESSLVFNAGVAFWKGRYVMVFRNDYGWKEEDWLPFKRGETESPPGDFQTNLGLAFSDDGVNWEVQPEPCWSWSSEEVLRVYDPRITIIEDVPHLCFAVDTRHGIRGGIARTEDFREFEVISLSLPDNRNMVLFPEKIGGRYARLERPWYGAYLRRTPEMWLSFSPDLIHWGDSHLVLDVDMCPFANEKLGPGAPPVWTEHGWLTTFHAVENVPGQDFGGWHAGWRKIYRAGIMLLDLHQPWKIRGISKTPLLTPEAAYETEGGFRNQVIFPGGVIHDQKTGEVKIYYGAGDAVECLATGTLDNLISRIPDPHQPLDL